MDHRIILVSAVMILVALVVLFANSPAFLSATSSPVISNNNVAVPGVKLDANVTYDYIIPPVNYTARGYEGIGLQYPPVAAALKCLFYFNDSRNETALSYGVYVADWLAQRGNETDLYISFTHDFPWHPYNLTIGWKSALAQAHAAECFLKTYEHTHDERYITLAQKALLFLRVPISQGGVMIDESSNNSKRWWYEEYPSEGGSYVLNGHQFVLIALAKYLDIAPNNQYVRELFDNGLRALKATALQYDNGKNYSYYDRLEGPADKYHMTHIINFQRLYDITGDEEWLRIKEMFEN